MLEKGKCVHIQKMKEVIKETRTKRSYWHLPTSVSTPPVLVSALMSLLFPLNLIEPSTVHSRAIQGRY